jgi:hypothetical protein
MVIRMEKKYHKAWMVNFISIILILGIFAISCLILTNIGIRVYQNVVLANDNNFELRTSLSYVATKIRQTDTEGYPKIEQKDGVDVLVLGEEIDGSIFETLIYHMDGNLYEIYHEAGADYELDYGQETMEIQDFTIQLANTGMVTFTATNHAGEQETLTVSLRTRR